MTVGGPWLCRPGERDDKEPRAGGGLHRSRLLQARPTGPARTRARVDRPSPGGCLPAARAHVALAGTRAVRATHGQPWLLPIAPFPPARGSPPGLADKLKISTYPHACLATLISATRSDTAALRSILSDRGFHLGQHGTDPLRPSRRLLHTPRYDALEVAFDQVGPLGRQMMNSTREFSRSAHPGAESPAEPGPPLAGGACHRSAAGGPLRELTTSVRRLDRVGVIAPTGGSGHVAGLDDASDRHPGPHRALGAGCDGRSAGRDQAD